MKIGVVGSINIDFVTVAEIAPKMGETVVGTSFHTVFGGKGANLAVAIGRLGRGASMFGAVGDDAFGIDAIRNLKDNNVDVANIATLKGESSGTASITVAEENNSIIVIGGANAKVDEKFVRQYEAQLKTCGIIGTQLEIDPSAVLWLSRFAKENGIKFVFNPSPDKEYDPEIIENSDIVIVNEIEIEKLGGAEALKKHSNKLILTEGPKGVSFYDGGKMVSIPAMKVGVVDTTGAGDTFMGALMVRISEGATMVEAIRFANVAAGLKCTKLGAQTGMPNREEVDEII